MSDQSGTADGQPTTENAEAPEKSAEPEAAPAWLAPIQERMDELGDSTSRLAEQVAGLQYTDDDDYDEDEDDDLYTDDDERQARREQREAFELIGGVVDERLAQQNYAAALDAGEEAWEMLRDEIPELADEKTARQYVGEVAEWCERVGAEHLIGTAEFVDLVEQRYRQGNPAAAAADGGESGQREVVLESAGGASAPSGSNEPDWGQRIVDAAERLRPQI